MAPRSSDASARRRRSGSFLVLSMIASLAFNAVGVLALQSDSMTACVDVGVQMHIRRRAAMPLEELSELQTGESCAKTTIMATIAEQAQSDLQNTELRVLDCVTTRIDEELVGLYAITRVCLHQHGESATTTMDTSALDAHVRPQIQRVFGPLSGAPSRGLALRYHESKVECEKLVITTSYTRQVAPENEDPIDDKNSAPRFKYKSAELWTVPAESNPLNSVVVLKLNVKNDGAVPLHVFAATVKSTDDTSTNLSGVLVLVPDTVHAIAPKTDAFVLFKFEVLHELALEDQAAFAVYFAHTASRAHTLDAKLDGKKLKISDPKKKFASKNRKTGAQMDETATLETVYAAFPYGAWQLMSVGIVMAVGIVTTVYMRRKWTRVHWSRSLDCFKSKPLKHKSSSLEMAAKRPVSYDPEDPSDAAVDTLESDGCVR